MNGDPALYDAEIAAVERRTRSILRTAHFVYWTTIAICLPPGIVIAVVAGLCRRGARSLKGLFCAYYH
jgi:hypothetical protein